MKSFLVTMKDFFGLREGQSVLQFGAEMKALSYEEKMWFHGELKKLGIECAEPAKA